MRTIIMLIVWLALTSVFAQSQAKGWRGLIPLHSTQTDVERLLGRADKEGVSSYIMQDVSVFFVYTGGACNSGWAVAKGTILNITVTMKNRPKFSELKLDLSLYSKERDGHLPDIILYINKGDGITYKVVNDEVTEIIYTPSESDEQLRCKPESTKPKKKRKVPKKSISTGYKLY